MLSLISAPAAHSPWRSLCELTCGAEAAILSARCQFSLLTAEVICSPDTVFFALTEQEHAETWRWAVYGERDTSLVEGSSPTRAEAGAIALKFLRQLERS